MMRSTLLRHLERAEVRFALVGGFNTVFGFAVFFALIHALPIGYIGVLLASYVISILVAFAMHRRFVFRSSGSLPGELARFSTVYLGALAANLFVLPALVEFAGLPVVLSQALFTAALAVASFFAHRDFTFRTR